MRIYKSQVPKYFILFDLDLETKLLMTILRKSSKFYSSV
jgi:hypothetical protein